ncbi:MAG: ABC transporter permease [Streptosporangiales bacterium]|nr:ABC transporter permease [Streptosporangiales bacterium]
MASRTASVWDGREVVSLLVRRDLKVKYQSSFLGYAWSMLEPLAMAAIYWFVFGVLYGQRVGPDGGGTNGYVIFLLAGLLPWLTFNAGITDSTRALTSQSKLITTMKVPREVFPLGVVAGKVVEFFFSLPVLLLFAVIFRIWPSWEGLYWLPAALLTQTVLLAGLALLLSSANVLLRDVQRIVRILTRLMFYAAPIIYPLSKVTDAAASGHVPVWLKNVYEANPIVGIMQMFHAVWFPSEAPDTKLLLTSVIGSLVVFAFGWWLFRRLEPAILKEL